MEGCPTLINRYSPIKNRASTHAFAVIQTHIVRPPLHARAGPASRSNPNREKRKMKGVQ